MLCVMVCGGGVCDGMDEGEGSVEVGMIDLMLYAVWGFLVTDRQTDGWTNERTFVLLGSLT